MSDFLSKFTKSEYDKTVEEKEVLTQAEPPRKKEEKEEKKLKVDKKKAKKQAKQITLEPEYVEEPKPVIVTARRSSHIEETTIDPAYQAKQRKKWIGSVLGVVLVVALGTAFYYFINQVRIPDYVNAPISELKSWANRNDVTLEIEQVFSLEFSRDYIVSMQPLANSKIQKGSNIQVVVSQGADPDEQIMVPDFTGNTFNQIQEWLSNNKINNLRITYEFHDEIPANEFVRIVFNDKNIKPETYTRKDFGLIYLSNGPEILPKDVKVDDWVTGNKNVALVQTWASTNNIELTINTVNSATVVDGGVIFQSIAPNTMIAKRSKLTINVSAGQQVIVPDFTTISREEASTMDPYGYSLRFVEMYQPKGGAAFGSLIWQDVSAGTKVDKTSQKQLVVTVYYSKGQPFINSMVDALENVIPQTIYDFNQDAANFTYEIKYVSDAAEKGTIIEMTPFNQFVDPGQHIIFIVSTGS